MSDRPALLPCPFCGSSRLSLVDAVEFVSCFGCGAEGPMKMGQPFQNAIDAWNTRAPIDDKFLLRPDFSAC
jgi:Lar family restriction alleviation protein